MNKCTILANEVLVYAYLGLFVAEISMVTPFLFIEFWVGAFLMFWVIFSRSILTIRAFNMLFICIGICWERTKYTFSL